MRAFDGADDEGCQCDECLGLTPEGDLIDDPMAVEGPLELVPCSGKHRRAAGDDPCQYGAEVGLKLVCFNELVRWFA